MSAGRLLASLKVRPIIKRERESKRAAELVGQKIPSRRTERVDSLALKPLPKVIISKAAHIL